MSNYPFTRMRALIATIAFLMVTPAAVAGEKIYADSFGNLIVHSPSGYKRIVVGKGHLARNHAHGERLPPKVAHLEERRGHLYLRERKACTQGTLLRGRGYMYGLPSGVLPVLSNC